MKTTIIETKVEISVSKDKIWEILADFGNVQNLSPGIAKSYLTSDVQTGLGASRHCDFTAMGAQVEEKIIEWEEGNFMKIELLAGIKHYAETGENVSKETKLDLAGIE